MGKVLALLLIILLALASVAGYLFLTEKITGHWFSLIGTAK